MLSRETAALMLVDVQGKLARTMTEPDRLIQNLATLIQGAQALSLPIFWIEQYPQGLGPTHSELQRLLDGVKRYEKMSFGVGGDPELMSDLAVSGRHQLLLCGIESHVCVYQSAAQLLQAGFEVDVVVDGVDARTPLNRRLGLERMQRLGAHLTSVEMALFELTERCDDPAFKSILSLVK
ncbi:isochorismatase family protein [Ferrimonas gelatinilytica]|uniref:Isochorismatase family protein n=1 Tax=Ferrimonas gelatinilytica TaxID=1255257 RepID=A0ABP9S2B1_9GAMM